MSNYFKKRLEAFRAGVPFRYKNIWYNQSIHTKELYPEVVDSKGDYISCKIGTRVVMCHDKKGNPVEYTVKRAWVRENAAKEYPSDGWMCDLDFYGVKK